MQRPTEKLQRRATRRWEVTHFSPVRKPLVRALEERGICARRGGGDRRQRQRRHRRAAIGADPDRRVVSIDGRVAAGVEQLLREVWLWGKLAAGDAHAAALKGAEVRGTGEWSRVKEGGVDDAQGGAVARDDGGGAVRARVAEAVAAEVRERAICTRK